MIGLTTAGGKMAWLLGPFLASVARHFPGVEWRPFEMPEREQDFSGRLLRIMAELEEDVFLWSCVDIFADAVVPLAMLESLDRFMAARGNVVRMGLAEEPWPCAPEEVWEGLPVVRCADLKACSIHAATAIDVSLFDRRNLARVLRPGWSIWDCEIKGTDEMLRKRPQGLESFAVRPGLFRKAELHRRDGFWWHLQMLDAEDRAAVVAARPQIGWQS